MNIFTPNDFPVKLNNVIVAKRMMKKNPKIRKNERKKNEKIIVESKHTQTQPHKHTLDTHIILIHST